jgi:lipopolysaccharide/colanic/teichoic acid biosynthesis glycosyltransferase
MWLDELPMLVNLFRGDMKVVGVRPLSQHYFSLYSSELQEKRIKYKPGLVPPYYADLPQTLEEIQESELSYLESFEKRPVRTQWRYFWKAFNNIVFKSARSA